LVALIFVVTVGTTAIVVFTQESVYRATMKMFVAQSGGGSQPDFGSQELSQTMKTLIESDVVAQQVIQNVGLDTTPPELLKKLHVSFRPDSSVLDVSYDSTSKAQALAVLDEYRKVFIAFVDQELGVRSRGSILGRQASLPGIVVKVFDPPHLQPDPVSPKPAKTLGFAAAFALALGLMLAFARESLDDRIRSSRDAEEWFGAPVVGTLPKTTRGASPAGVAGRRHESEGLLEAMNLLRANLEFSPNGVAGPTILVTSALSREGKTTVAANLASVLAMGGHKVICVEADARRPALRGYMGGSAATEGLLEVLNGDVDLDGALQTIELVGPGGVEPRRVGLGRKNGARPAAQQAPFVGGELRLLPIGTSSRNPGMVFSAEKVAPLINDLRARADFVILDSSPLLTLADSFLLAQLSDDVLVVARQGQTKKDKAEAVRARLQGLGVERIGVILTNSTLPEGRGYYS
jgi:Mrp family chromosome partitioning ATPase/capsular polysaccharide biosynthesis protein